MEWDGEYFNVTDYSSFPGAVLRFLGRRKTRHKSGLKTKPPISPIKSDMVNPVSVIGAHKPQQLHCLLTSRVRGRALQLLRCLERASENRSMVLWLGSEPVLIDPSLRGAALATQSSADGTEIGMGISSLHALIFIASATRFVLRGTSLFQNLHLSISLADLFRDDQITLSPKRSDNITVIIFPRSMDRHQTAAMT